MGGTMGTVLFVPLVYFSSLISLIISTISSKVGTYPSTKTSPSIIKAGGLSTL